MSDRTSSAARTREQELERALRLAVRAFAQYALDTNNPPEQAVDDFVGGLPARRTIPGGGEMTAAQGRLEDPLEGANCSLCGATADNFHVPDDLWERVGLGPVQACFKCFRIAAFHAGVKNGDPWEVGLG